MKQNKPILELLEILTELTVAGMALAIELIVNPLAWIAAILFYIAYQIT